jgi:hypothetical protein
MALLSPRFTVAHFTLLHFTSLHLKINEAIRNLLGSPKFIILNKILKRRPLVA